MIKKEGADKTALWRGIASTAHRLLKCSTKVFSEIWNWSPFYALLQHPDSLVRWHAGESVSLLLMMNDSTKETFMHTTLGFDHDHLLSKR